MHFFFSKNYITSVSGMLFLLAKPRDKNYIDMSFVAMLIVTAHDQLERSCLSEIVFTVKVA